MARARARARTGTPLISAHAPGRLVRLGAASCGADEGARVARHDGRRRLRAGRVASGSLPCTRTSRGCCSPVVPRKQEAGACGPYVQYGGLGTHVSASLLADAGRGIVDLPAELRILSAGSASFASASCSIHDAPSCARLRRLSVMMCARLVCLPTAFRGEGDNQPAFSWDAGACPLYPLGKLLVDHGGRR
eukprot:scaffold52442_cov66-Phaeocystis_antarctica.AAC.3